MSYVDHAWRHRPKALGGTDPIESASVGAAVATLSKTGTEVTISTPWADQSVYMPWNSHSVGGTNGADHFAYTADVGDGNPGMQVLTGGEYVIDWYVFIHPKSTATTNTTRLIPPYLHFIPVLSPTGSGTFVGESVLGTLRHWSSCVWDSGVNERSIENANTDTPTPALGGSERFDISDDDANLPYTFTGWFVAYDGAHDYSYVGANLRIIRLGDYIFS